LRDETIMLAPGGDNTLELTVRLALGQDPETLLAGPLEPWIAARRLVSLGTARQGLSIEAVYSVAIRDERSAGQLVTALNRLEGVQSVMLRRAGPEMP
jgi:hypothetical protein